MEHGGDSVISSTDGLVKKIASDDLNPVEKDVLLKQVMQKT